MRTVQALCPGCRAAVWLRVPPPGESADAVLECCKEWKARTFLIADWSETHGPTSIPAIRFAPSAAAQRPIPIRAVRAKRAKKPSARKDLT